MLRKWAQMLSKFHRQGLELLRTLAVYTVVILGPGDTPDDYHPYKVILVQHEGVWVILFMLSKSHRNPQW